MFVAGYALVDPGGSAGLLMGLAWVAPMLILAGLAWFWPAAAAPLLISLTAAVVAVCVWSAIDEGTARSLMEASGPVLAVAVLALAFPAAVLGLKKTATAAWLLLALSVLPFRITMVAGSGPAGSLSAAVVLPLTTGVLCLLAAQLERLGAAWNRQARDVTEIGPGSNGR